MEANDIPVAILRSPALRFCCSAKYGTCAAWIQPAGELDLASAPVLQRHLAQALSHAVMVVLDLRQLSFIDAAGLHVICDASESAKAQDRRLMVMRGPARVHRVFTLTGVSEKLVIFDVAGGDRDLADADADADADERRAFMRARGSLPIQGEHRGTVAIRTLDLPARDDHSELHA